MVAHNIVLSVLYCFCAAKADCFLQLNGYRADGNFFKYYKTDFSAWAIVASAVSCVVYFVFPTVWLYVHAGLTIMLAVGYLAESKKTPLRRTARMVRLMITQWALLLACAFLFDPAVFLLLPYVALAANAINLPIETCVRAHYLQKAKLKLANYPDLRIIAVTGSYGKTSVKDALTAVLQEKFKVVKTPNSFNTPMGVAKTINEACFDGVDFFVCEMGARRQGDIAALCKIAKPHFVVLTGIAPQHMQTFGSLSCILQTKLEAVSCARDGATVFLNCDCVHLKYLVLPGKNVVTAGADGEVSYRVTKCGEDGCDFTVTCQGQKIDCSTRLLGAHNVSNLCLCAAVGLFLGLNDAQIQHAFEDLDFTPHRLQLMQGANGVRIIDDGYNANLQGIRQSAEVLKTFRGKKIVVAAGIIEGGKNAAHLNREAGKAFADCCDFALLVGVNADFLAEGLLQGGFDQNNIMRCKSTAEAGERAGELAMPGDVILFSNDLPDNVL